MLTRLASTIVLVLPVFAAAAVIQPYSQCNTGALQCCNSVESVSIFPFVCISCSDLSLHIQASNPSALATGLLSLLNVVVGDITGQVGRTSLQ